MGGPCDVSSWTVGLTMATVASGLASMIIEEQYSKRSSDRNRGFWRSQPISIRGREIQRPASEFLSDRNRDFLLRRLRRPF